MYPPLSLRPSMKGEWPSQSKEKGSRVPLLQPCRALVRSLAALHGFAVEGIQYRKFRQTESNDGCPKSPCFCMLLAASLVVASPARRSGERVPRAGEYHDMHRPDLCLRGPRPVTSPRSTSSRSVGSWNFGDFPYADASGYNLDNQCLVFKVKLPTGVAGC